MIAIAILFFIASAYLTTLAIVWFVNPNALPLSLGAPLLHGLELAGPYMFFICAAIGWIVGIGLLRLNNFARRAAILIAAVGIVMLLPKISAAAGDISARLFLAALQAIARVMLVWYLWQNPVAKQFH